MRLKNCNLISAHGRKMRKCCGHTASWNKLCASKLNRHDGFGKIDMDLVYHGTVCIDKAWTDEDCIEQALLDAFEKSQVDLVRNAVENKKGVAESSSTGLADSIAWRNFKKVACDLATAEEGPVAALPKFQTRRRLEKRCEEAFLGGSDEQQTQNRFVGKMVKV
eukprot:symbB.v1.2.019653.t1/scaffold1584.1/size110534/12